MFLKPRLHLKRILVFVLMAGAMLLVIFFPEDDSEEDTFFSSNILFFDSGRYLKMKENLEAIHFSDDARNDGILDANDNERATEKERIEKLHLTTQIRKANEHEGSRAGEHHVTRQAEEALVENRRSTMESNTLTRPRAISESSIDKNGSEQMGENRAKILNNRNSSGVQPREILRGKLHPESRGIKKTIPGQINVYTWTDVCLEQDNYNLYWHPLFPRLPNKGYFMNKLQDNDWIRSRVLRRLIGYLHVSKSGLYKFKMSARDGLEMMLFKTRFRPDDVILRFGIFKQDIFEQRPRIGRFELYRKTSVEVELEQGHKYPLDIVHSAVHFGRMRIEIKEKNDTEYKVVDSENLSPYRDTNEINSELIDAYFLNTTLTSVQEKFKQDQRIFFGDKIQLNSRTCPTGLNICNYEPTYLYQGKKINLYFGQQYLRKDLIYPDDNIKFKNETYERILDKATAETVAKEVFKAISDANNGKFKLKHIVHVEQNNEQENGKRYFVELDLEDEKEKKMYRFSDYFHKPSEDGALCLPEIYKTWRSDVPVYLICAIKNQRQWFRYLIDSLGSLIERTNDQNLHLVVIDFHSEDVNVKNQLEESKLKFTYLNLEGNFSKVIALNEGVKRVPNNDSIVFVLDLQLQIPDHIFDQARKHTVQGRMTYCPILIRLQCGEHPEYTKLVSSLWMEIGYGMISIYKSDWDKIGGMNEEMFRYKWGGEDWEFVDRIVVNQLELVHQRLPGFYHIYHSTTETWDGTKLFK